MNSIRPIIEVLEKSHAHFNGALFSGRLKHHPVITVQTNGRKSAYGWYGAGFWENGSSKPAELNISAEDLKREPQDVLLTLAHEMVHQLADEQGVKDTSRGGRYHNKKFRDLAEGIGLVAPGTPDPKLGFSAVTFGASGTRGRAAFDSLDSTLWEAFVLARRVLPTRPSKGKMKLYECGCEPVWKIRCGKTDLRATCNFCGELFELQG